MKVLILHQHFNTPSQGGALRSYYLAKALSDRGIETVVITGYNGKNYCQEVVENILVHYLPVAYDNKFGFSQRVSSFLKFAWKSAQVASRIKEIDYCYAISVPLTMGLPALWMKFRKRTPFVFEVGDLWPEAPIQMGVIKNYFLIRFLYWLEKYIYRHAHSIVALSPAIQEAVENKIHSKTIHIIPNMADCDFFSMKEDLDQRPRTYSEEDRFVISYIGATGPANGLDFFLECANASRKANLPIQFLLCGKGALLERLKRNAGQLGLQNLKFLDHADRDGVKNILAMSDAVFVCYKNLPILETGSPNKFFDGLAAGRMIIINFGGWMKKEIERNGCGIALDPKDPVDFVKKIRPVLADSRILRNFQIASRNLAEQKYSRELLSNKFARIFLP